MKLYEAMGCTAEDCCVAATCCFIRAWSAWLEDDLWWAEHYLRGAVHYINLLVSESRR